MLAIDALSSSPLSSNLSAALVNLRARSNLFYFLYTLPKLLRVIPSSFIVSLSGIPVDNESDVYFNNTFACFSEPPCKCRIASAFASKTS